MMRDSALERFMARVAESRELLATIQGHVDNHFGVAPEDVHWGHVTNAGDAAHRLRQLVEELQLQRHSTGGFD